MPLFHLTIRTPDSSLLEVDAESLLVRATDGDITILADHEDTIVTLDVCLAEVVDEKSEKIIVLINGGIMQIKQNEVSVNAVEGEVIDTKEKNVSGKQSHLIERNKLVLDEVKEALEQGGYYKPEIELSTLLAEERAAKYELLKEIKE